MRDIFSEIWNSVRRNKLRTCLTGFAVAWGIFMLIVLLGAGNGLINAILQGSEGVSLNTMTVSGGVTSKPYGGLSEGRSITLEASDMEVFESESLCGNVDEVMSSIYYNGTAVFGKNSASSCLVYGVYPGYLGVDGIKISSGRFINETDLEQRRKTAVFSDRLAEMLLGDGRAAEELMGLAYETADLIEQMDYSSDILTWFCISYEKAAFCGFEAGMTAEVEKLVTTMSDRFARSLAESHGGLLAVVRYSEAIFFMGRDDDRARDGFDAIQRVMAASIDNGPFTVDRFLCSILALERLGGGGVKPVIGVETAMHAGLTKEAFLGYLELYIRALSDSRTVSQMSKDLAGSGVHFPEKVIADFAEKPFEPSILWDCPVLRAMAD